MWVYTYTFSVLIQHFNIDSIASCYVSKNLIFNYNYPKSLYFGKVLWFLNASFTRLQDICEADVEMSIFEK